MQVSYLFFVVFVLILGSNSFVHANSTKSKENTNVQGGIKESRFRKFVNNLNGVELKFPKISRKKFDEKHTLESLTTRLQEIEKIRNGSKNPFKKLRCYIQESNIKRKIRSLLKEKEEEEKLEKLEEEFSMDYSPQILSEEGSVPPYIPVVVGSFKENTNASERSIRNEEGNQANDSSLSEEMIEPRTEESEEVANPITSEIDKIDVESDEDRVHEDTESAAEVSEENLEDEPVTNLDQSQAISKDQQTSSILKENTTVEEKSDQEKQGTVLRLFSKLFKNKKPVVGDDLEKLLAARESIEGKISSSKNKIVKKYLETKLQNINKRISKVTESAVDAVTESGEIDIN
ncbi:uncharacterized protein cubi_00632 [Cryptosporidium ubiquitum]|uniref:Signal peptide-containing protein n=1 Tax=Cryptosporidium ubiquitum TaxID=857276 RepID=A0A1J4MC60_9CRYT|nr:uncharacterized protein cubi_00632 [Cryptosporidium ubiquitum]OII71824.1 hypothetical protein cubi_00632 [Cryptosporidium ubiquitum]